MIECKLLFVCLLPKGGLLELVRMAVGLGKWCSESGLEMEAIE